MINVTTHAIERFCERIANIRIVTTKHRKNISDTLLDCAENGKLIESYETMSNSHIVYVEKINYNGIIIVLISQIDNENGSRDIVTCYYEDSLQYLRVA